MNITKIQQGARLAAAMTAIAMSLALTACGGGGGGSSTTTGSGSTSTGSTTSGNLATSVPTPTYAAGSAELTMFNQLNQVRAAGGFGMLAQNTALDQSTKNHANYMFLNYYAAGVWNTNLTSTEDTATGWLYAHSETPGNPGFTGTVPVNRAIYANYNAYYVAEVIVEAPGNEVQSGLQAGCVQTLLSTVFHRSGLLNIQLRDFGASVSVASDQGGTACIVDPAFTTANQSVPPTGWVGVYPYSGQTGVNATFTGETPDPVPTAPIKGQPVSIYVEPQNTLVVTSFTLTDNTGAQVPVQLLTQSSFPQYITAAMAYIVPTVALKSATTYTVQFVGTNNGAPLSRTWNFTTQ